MDLFGKLLKGIVFQLIDRDAILEPEIAAPDAPEFGKRRKTAEDLSQIVDKSSQVGPL